MSAEAGTRVTECVECAMYAGTDEAPPPHDHPDNVHKAGPLPQGHPDTWPGGTMHMAAEAGTLDEAWAAAGTRHYRDPHKPVGGGLCEHRWRNRTTVQVHCGWADGYRAALAATPEPREDGWEELRRAAKWLVDIHADDIAIPKGSALWEDLQSLKAALAAARGEPPAKRKRTDWSNVVVDEGDEAP